MAAKQIAEAISGEVTLTGQTRIGANKNLGTV